MNRYIAILMLIVTSLTASANADSRANQQQTLTEAEVKQVSDAVYTWILEQSAMKGHRFSPEQIQSGYRHHLEELKLQLIDRGYIILAGEGGA